MSYQSIDAGITERFFTVVKRSNGDPVVAGTVNYYLKAKSGANAGKWWKDSDQTWADTETANAMQHDEDGHWEIDLTSSPFIDGIRFLEYVKESGNLHVPDSRHLIAGTSVKDILEADHYIKTSTTPWQLVLIKKGSGTLSTGTVLLTQNLKTEAGANVTSIETFIGQQVG